MINLDALKEKEGCNVKRLIGHSGPVYGSSFSYDNRFLLSCSQDSTGKKIIITHLQTNLNESPPL